MWALHCLCSASEESNLARFIEQRVPTGCSPEIELETMETDGRRSVRFVVGVSRGLLQTLGWWEWVRNAWAGPVAAPSWSAADKGESGSATTGMREQDIIRSLGAAAQASNTACRTQTERDKVIQAHALGKSLQHAGTQHCSCSKWQPTPGHEILFCGMQSYRIIPVSIVFLFQNHLKGVQPRIWSSSESWKHMRTLPLKSTRPTGSREQNSGPQFKKTHGITGFFLIHSLSSLGGNNHYYVCMKFENELVNLNNILDYFTLKWILSINSSLTIKHCCNISIVTCFQVKL